MGKDRTENFESPLDEVLHDLPQENPPRDLRQRCVNALDQIDAEQGRSPAPQWFLSLRNVIATAAVLVLAVGLFTLLPLFIRLKQATPMASRLSSEKLVETAPGRALAPPSQPAPKVAAGPGMAPGMAGPRPAPPVPEAPAEREGPLDADVVKLQTPGPVVLDKTARRPAMLPESVIVTHPSTHQAPEVEEPWRDLSGERQVVVDKELELEVKDVEKSYDETRLIVEKHSGFVASDEISIDAHALDTAVLTIRLPKDGFEPAIAELRKLGTVIKLVGESQDVTEEYFSQGAEIRSRADREQMLVEKYEKETNPRKKRQLEAEIEQLRREMRREKEILTKLAEETHWPTLQLTLKERGGPAGFLSEMLERSGRALAWVGATAIIWVPLVVLLTLFWGRRRRT